MKFIWAQIVFLFLPLAGGNAWAQNEKLNAQTFKTRLPDQLSDPKLANLRQHISEWASTHDEQVGPFRELNLIATSNAGVLDQIRIIRASSQGSRLTFLPTYDFNGNGALDLLDWYEAELYRSRLSVDSLLHIPSKLHRVQKLDGKTIADRITTDFRRLEELSGMNLSSGTALYRERQILENTFGELEWNHYLQRIRPAIQSLDLLETNLGQTFESRDSLWKHRPRTVPHLIPAQLDIATLQTNVDGWIQVLLENVPRLRIQYSSLDLPKDFEKHLSEIEAGLIHVRDFLARESGEIKQKYLVEDYIGMAFIYGFDPDGFNASLKSVDETGFDSRERAFGHFDPSLVGSILARGGGGLPPENSQYLDSGYIDAWVALVKALSETPITDRLIFSHPVMGYAAWAKGRFDTATGIRPPYAVEWAGSSTGALPDFETTRESLSWKLLTDQTVADWTAEFQSLFLKERVLAQRMAAKQLNLNFDALNDAVRADAAEKTNLRNQLRTANEEEEPQLQGKLDQLTEKMNKQADQLDAIDNDAAVKAYPPEEPGKYAERMKWKTPHDESRHRQIETELGFSDGCRELHTFLEATKGTGVLPSTDLNRDGDVDSSDVSLAPLLREATRTR